MTPEILTPSPRVVRVFNSRGSLLLQSRIADPARSFDSIIEEVRETHEQAVFVERSETELVLTIA